MLVILGVGELLLAALLVDDLGGHGWLAPAVCLAIAASAARVLLSARRRAPDDPTAARALTILGAGLALAALGLTSLVLAVFSAGL